MCTSTSAFTVLERAEGADRPVRPQRRRARRATAWLAGAACLLVPAVWLGLRAQPAPLPAPPLVGTRPEAVALPDGLPAPVERFYRALYGAQVPAIQTVVVSGRATMRIQGITFPSRYRFSHVTGESYRHYIQTTVFGVPLLSVDEWFLDGTARLELPFGVSSGPEVDQGANLALWAELVWAPSVWVTDPAVRWESVDAGSARLVVPFGETEETFLVTFDPHTALLHRMESLRFKGEGATSRTPWINEVREWGQLDGQTVPLVTAVRWGDESTPWAVLRTEELMYNADLRAYIRSEGP